MSNKRGKDDEKMMMGPMFPRLHVNDADKGGPKAPPRNKMALYEQLSIPSQRFSNVSANPVPPSRQEFANTFFSNQLPTRHQSEKQNSQYSDSSAPLEKVERRKKPDEHDFRVPTFLHSRPNQECGEYNTSEKIATFIPSYFNRPSKFRKGQTMGAREISTSQEGKNHNKEDRSSKEVVNDRVKGVLNQLAVEKAEDMNKQTDLSLRHGPRDTRASVFEENIAALERRSCSNSVRSFPSKDLSDGSSEMRNVERGESVCEASVMDSVSRVDVTPDDVVGIIGPKHFWKARRAIVNQQRVFAVQVFELHRLIKVQKSIAGSPHLLLDESSYFSKPKMDPPVRKIPLKYPIKSIPIIPKQKGEPPEKPTQEKEVGRESSFASVQNCAPSSISSSGNAIPWNFSQSPHGHQWLIPVMSPSEGLVYKPYPGPGFVGPAPSSGGCGPAGSNRSTGEFLSPHPHAYFPNYGMPIMNPPPFPCPDLDVSIRTRMSEGVGAVQVSEVGSPVQDSGSGSGGATEVRSVLQLFPTSPAVDATARSSHRPPKHGRQEVIKVVPHNARSATESVARIFQSIQEERKQYNKL